MPCANCVFVYTAQGDLPRAHATFADIMQTVDPAPLEQHPLPYLMAYARLLITTTPIRSAELLSLAEHARSQRIRMVTMLMEMVRSDLRSKLTEAEYSAAYSRGLNLDLAQVFEEMRELVRCGSALRGSATRKAAARQRRR